MKSRQLKRLLSTKVLSFAFGTCLLLFAFQNCGFSMGGSGGNKGLAIDDGFLEWDSFYKDTQPSDINFHRTVMPFAFDDSSALLISDRGVSIYDNETQKVRLLLSSQFYRLGTPMRFPTLGFVVIAVRDEYKNLTTVKVINVKTGQTVLDSPALAAVPQPCLFSPQDEAQGILLCAFANPTASDSKEIRLSLLDLKTLKFTMLAPVPAGYNLQRNWTVGMNELGLATPHYPFTKEAKALVTTYDPNGKSTLMLLTATEATVWPDSTVYDFRGTGVTKTFLDFYSQDVGVVTNLSSKCPANISQYPHAIRFSTRSWLQHDKACTGDAVLVFPASKDIQKCTSPQNCTDLKLKVGEKALFNSYSNPIYFEKTNTLLVAGFFGDAFRSLLVSINVETGENKNIELGEPTTIEVVERFTQAFTIENSVTRKFNDTYARAYKIYIPEQDKVFDMPLIENSGEFDLSWYQRRILNGVPYAIGVINFSLPTAETYVVNLLTQEISRIPGRLLFDRDIRLSNLNDPQISMRNTAGETFHYNVVTKAKTMLPADPANYRPHLVVRNGLYTALLYESLDSGSPTKKLIVYKNNEIVFERTGLLSDVGITADLKGIHVRLQQDATPNNFFVFRYDFETGFKSADIPCTTNYSCQFDEYLTDAGTLVITQNGKIFDNKLNLVMDAQATFIQPNLSDQNSAKTKVSFLYFQKSALNPNNSSEYLQTVTRFDTKTKKLESLVSNTPDRFFVIGDVLVTSKMQNGKSIGTEFSYAGKTLYQTSSLYVRSSFNHTILQERYDDEMSYSYFPTSQVHSAKNGNTTQIKVKSVKTPAISGGVNLDYIFAGRIWWYTNDMGAGRKYFRTTLR